MMIIGVKDGTHGEIGSRSLNMGVMAESEVEQVIFPCLMMRDTDAK